MTERESKLIAALNACARAWTIIDVAKALRELAPTLPPDLRAKLSPPA